MLLLPQSTFNSYSLQTESLTLLKKELVSRSQPELIQICLGLAKLKVENKKKKLTEYMEENNLSPRELLFMGDDIPDYTAMQIAGLACAPADAAPEIKQISQYISPVRGGYGCARDVIEKVLKLNDHWPMDTTIRSK